MDKFVPAVIAIALVGLAALLAPGDRPSPHATTGMSPERPVPVADSQEPQSPMPPWTEAPEAGGEMVIAPDRDWPRGESVTAVALPSPLLLPWVLTGPAPGTAPLSRPAGTLPNAAIANTVHAGAVWSPPGESAPAPQHSSPEPRVTPPPSAPVVSAGSTPTTPTTPATPATSAGVSVPIWPPGPPADPPTGQAASPSPPGPTPQAGPASSANFPPPPVPVITGPAGPPTLPPVTLADPVGPLLGSGTPALSPPGGWGLAANGGPAPGAGGPPMAPGPAPGPGRPPPRAVDEPDGLAAFAISLGVLLSLRLGLRRRPG